MSTTDPDATPMRTGARTTLGYHDHYVVDGGKRRIILAALVTPADVMENVPLRDLLWRVCFRRKIWPHQVTGDTTYGTTENIVALEDAGIRAYVPLPDLGSRRPAFFAQTDFTYDPERDEYRCPQQHPLKRETAKHSEGVVVYRAPATTCNACPIKTQCTESAHGRIVHRSFYADYLERVRAYHATEAYQKAMRKRQVWVEPLFAEAKAWHGLRRLRLRGLSERQYPGTPHRGRPEPQTLPGGHGVGASPSPMWEPSGPPEGVRRALGRLRVTIASTRTRADSAGRTMERTHEQPHHRPFSTAWPLIGPITVLGRSFGRSR